MAAETKLAGLPVQTDCEAGSVVTTGISETGSLQLKLISFNTGVNAVLLVANTALYWMNCEVPPMVAPLDGMDTHEAPLIAPAEAACRWYNDRVVPTGTVSVHDATPQSFTLPASNTREIKTPGVL